MSEYVVHIDFFLIISYNINIALLATSTDRNIMETTTAPKYNVQCMRGHVAEVLPGTELEKRCIERENKGYIDALCLGPNDCIQCVGDAQYDQDRELDNADSFCFSTDPDHDLFCQGCLTPEEIAEKFPPIPDSQYDKQMRMALPW
jgi:hypothetical protein